MKPVAGMLAAVCLLALATAGASARPDFRAALDAQMSAIAARDVAAYAETISENDDLWLIFSDGQRLETREDVLAFHRNWFADRDWVMRPELIRIIEGEDMAMALYSYAYRDTPDGEPRSSWLLLLFKLEDGVWRLVHDQNTRIIDQEPEPVE